MGVYRELSQIDSIVIHCADTPNGRANTIEDIDDWHAQRGFRRDPSIAPKHQPHLRHVGYHYVIEIDGAVRAGRPVHETGAHVAGHNDNTLGICLVGQDQFAQAQWDALRTLVESIQSIAVQRMGLTIEATFGHRDLDDNKICPGFDVIEWISNGYQPLPQHVLDLEGRS